MSQFIRAGNGRLTLDTQVQWQPTLGTHGADATSLAIGADLANIAGDVVPMPTGPTLLTIGTDQILPLLAAPPTLAEFLADPPATPRAAPPMVRRVDGWQAPPLGAISRSVPDADAPRRAILIQARAPLDWSPPPLVTGLTSLPLDPAPLVRAARPPVAPQDATLGPLFRSTPADQDPPRIPPTRRQIPVDGWFPVALTPLAPWFASSELRPPLPIAPRIIEPWGLDPVAVLGAAPLDLALRSPAPRSQVVPQDQMFDAIFRSTPADQDPPRVAPARRPVLADGWFAPPLTPLAPWFAASELRPPLPIAPRIIEPWGLDPLPVLGKTPLDLFPMLPTRSPSRVPADLAPPPLMSPGAVNDSVVAPVAVRAPARMPADWSPPPLVVPLATYDTDPPPRAMLPRAPTAPPELTPRALFSPTPIDLDPPPVRSVHRQPLPEGWHLVPLAQLAPWFDGTPPRWFPQPMGPRIIEPWGLDPLPVLARALLDDVPRPRPIVAMRVPQDFVAAAARGAIFDLLTPAPIAVVRHPLAPDPALAPIFVSPLLPWFAATETRPQPWRRPPYFESWGADPLPVLGMTPLDTAPQRPIPATGRPTMDLVLDTLRAPPVTADAYPAVRPPATVLPAQEPVLHALGGSAVLVDEVVPPRAWRAVQSVAEQLAALPAVGVLLDDVPRVLTFRGLQPVAELLGPVGGVPALEDAAPIQRLPDPRTPFEEILSRLVPLLPVLADAVPRALRWVPIALFDGSTLLVPLVPPAPPVLLPLWGYAWPDQVSGLELLGDGRTDVEAAATATTMELLGDGRTDAEVLSDGDGDAEILIPSGGEDDLGG
jgi:hypothetical protein